LNRRRVAAVGKVQGGKSLPSEINGGAAAHLIQTTTRNIILEKCLFLKLAAMGVFNRRKDGTNHDLTEKTVLEGEVHDVNANINDRGSAIVEDEHHHLHRGLKGRQVAMIAIGGAVGTGLIIGTSVNNS
jgi:hypothetical protein